MSHLWCPRRPGGKVKKEGRRTVSVEGDISTSAGVDAISGQLLQLGKVDILVNNAGMFPFIDLWEVTFLMRV